MSYTAKLHNDPAFAEYNRELRTADDFYMRRLRKLLAARDLELQGCPYANEQKKIKERCQAAADELREGYEQTCLRAHAAYEATLAQREEAP